MMWVFAFDGIITRFPTQIDACCAYSTVGANLRKVPTQSGMAVLCSPNEDFGRIDKRGNPDFRWIFQWLVA
jgi:hypothetical protein